MIRNNYPSVGTGQCIYCGVPEELCELTEEHIIAEAIGGKMTLPRASCGGCGAITSAFEGHCCEDMFKSLRLERNIRGKKRKGKKRPTHLPIIEEFSPQVELSERTLVPIQDYPSHLILPIFEEPGILLRREPTIEFRNVNFLFLYVYNDVSNNAEARVERLKKSGLTGVKVYEEFRFGEFVRMLAKIGHAFAMAEFGAGVFEPLLLKVIRENDLFGPYLVGGTSGRSPPDAELHRVHTELWDLDNQALIIARIRLFADLSPLIPVYTVVVGRLLDRTLYRPPDLV
jgi:hypothetical protein